MELRRLLRRDDMRLHRTHGQGVREPPLPEEECTADAEHPDGAHAQCVHHRGEDDVKQAEPEHRAEHAGREAPIGAVPRASHIGSQTP